MSEYVSQNDIQIAQVLFDFVNDRALPGTGVDGAQAREAAGTDRRLAC